MGEVNNVGGIYLKIRKAEQKDIEALVSCRLDFLAEDSKKSLPESLWEANSAYFAESILNGSCICWLALEGEMIIATGGICFYRQPPNYSNPTGQVAYIMNMYTRPGYRKQGLASRLFAKLLDEARVRDIKKVCLNASDMGRPLYEKFGFKTAENEMALYLK